MVDHATKVLPLWLANTQAGHVVAEALGLAVDEDLPAVLFLRGVSEESEKDKEKGDDL